MPAWPSVGDQLGANVTAHTSDGALWGTYYNINRFYLPVAEVLNILKYNGTNAGFISISAREIVIDGMLNASGSGFGGGGGGACHNSVGAGYGGGNNGSSGIW